MAFDGTATVFRFLQVYYRCEAQVIICRQFCHAENNEIGNQCPPGLLGPSPFFLAI